MGNGGGLGQSLLGATFWARLPGLKYRRPGPSRSILSGPCCLPAYQPPGVRPNPPNHVLLKPRSRGASSIPCHSSWRHSYQLTYHLGESVKWFGMDQSVRQFCVREGTIVCRGIALFRGEVSTQPQTPAETSLAWISLDPGLVDEHRGSKQKRVLFGLSRPCVQAFARFQSAISHVM